MNEIKQFLSMLKLIKRKLVIEHFIRYFHTGLLLSGIAVFLIALIARVFVLLYVNQIMIILAGIIILLSIITALFKKPDNYDAAVLYDNYVSDDRVKTALTYLKDKSDFSRLQRRDALLHMKKSIPDIENNRLKLFHWKKIVMIAFLCIIAALSVIYPNDVMEIANQQEKDEEIAKQTKEEIKQLSDEEKENEQLEELEKQTKDIKNSEELLAELLEKEASLEEKKQEALKNEQQLKELAKATDEFKDLANALNQADSKKMQEALRKLEEKLPALSEQQQETLENLLSEVTGKEINNISELTEEQIENLLASMEEQLENLINSAGSLNQLANSQENLQQLASSLNQNMTDAGLSNASQLSFASQSPGNQNNGSNQNQNGQSSSGNNGSNGNSNGQGQNGQGSEAGSGSGSGNASGSGNGNGGSGTGSGSGAGFGQGSRELTIPEKIDGDESVENDFGELGEGNGQQQTAPEAPVLKGTLRSYEEIYGNYESAYRESVERMDLPDYLEDVVKDYFSDLNPEGE